MEDAYVFSNIEGIFWREKLKDSDLLVEKWCSYHHFPKKYRLRNTMYFWNKFRKKKK